MDETKFCILESHAFVTGFPKELFTQIIGHDGMEIVRPGMKKPYCYKSFTPAEMSYALYTLAVSQYPLMYPLYTKVFNIGAYDLIIYKGTHCMGWKDGQLLDLTNKYKTFLEVLPCSMLVILNK